MTIIKFYALLITISTIALFAGVITSIAIKSGKDTKYQRDPCWFIDLKDKSVPYDVISKREAREMRGYPEDIPLSEAIKIFNEEKQCVSDWASYPPLTEDELIAAIVAGQANILIGEAKKYQENILWKIATKKVMPKGTLLYVQTGPRVQESPLRPEGTIRAIGISIELRLGLENYEYGQGLKPEQIFLIRRTYFKVETIK
jgi:hypothetical protein